mmetsp:Transcript_4417/g.20052  ORF Transcript_4417/g.20052 Transcript_4417/m.20052 type:complete len:317 (+) Transcript_4417:187-1137(+)
MAPLRARATVSSYRAVASVVLSKLLRADHSPPRMKSNIPPDWSSSPPSPSSSVSSCADSEVETSRLDAFVPYPVPSSSRSFTAGPVTPSVPSPVPDPSSPDPASRPASPSPTSASSSPAPSASAAAFVASFPILTICRVKLTLFPPSSFASLDAALATFLPVPAVFPAAPFVPSDTALMSSQVSFRLASHLFCRCCLAKNAMSSRLTLRLSTLAWCALAASCHPRRTPKKKNVSILRLRRLRLLRGSRSAQLHAAVAKTQPRKAPSISSDHAAYANLVWWETRYTRASSFSRSYTSGRSPVTWGGSGSAHSAGSTR